MPIRVVATFVLASCLGLASLPAHAQPPSAGELALSYGAGSAFQDVGVGLAPTSAVAGSAYSFSAGFGGGGHGYWGSRYFGGLSHGYGCADVWSVLSGPYHGAFAAGFYDDWFYLSDLYFDCVVRGPSWVYHRYHAYRPFYSGYPRFRHHRPRAIYISIAIFDPFWWGWGPHHRYDPFHAYDPWGHYSSRWVVYSGPGVRRVYVSPGPVYRRPSPIYVAGTTFKEDPRGGAAGPPERRTAQPRPTSAPRASAPEAGPQGIGIQAPPRRTAAASGGSAADGSTPAPPSRGRTAAPRRSGDAGERTAAPGPAGNAPRSAQGDGERPVVSPGPAPREGSGEAATGAVLSTPSAVNRPPSSTREAGPTSRLPQVITPQNRPSRSGASGDARSETALPRVIAPRSAEPGRTGAPEPPPAEVEHLTGPAPTQPGRRPSGATAEPRGSAPQGSPLRPSDAVRGRPTDPAAPQTQPGAALSWSTAPRTERSNGGAATGPDSQRQAQPAPSRRAEPASREAPAETRPAEPRTAPRPEARRSAPPESRQSPPETRQASPPARQAPPQTRQSPPQVRQAPPETRSAPSRPPSAQPAPSSGSARPLPAPRRPSGGS